VSSSGWLVVRFGATDVRVMSGLNSQAPTEVSPRRGARDDGDGRSVSVTTAWEHTTGRGPVWVVEITGEVDLASASELIATLDAAPPGTATVVVDLAGVTFIDAAGLRALSEIVQAGAARNLTVELRSPSPVVLRIAELADFDLFRAGAAGSGSPFCHPDGPGDRASLEPS
jgi:anti-sigma B factor antagonist